VSERSGERYTLTFPARERSRAAVSQMAEPKTIQCGRCSPSTLVATQAGETRLNRDVVEAVEIVDEVET
jgi:hypothetical protein